MKRRNKNRGYQQLVVWQDAIDYYKLTTESFRPAGFEMGGIISQQLASVDSVHRNIAEGYCRRSIKEYIHYLYITLGLWRIRLCSNRLRRSRPTRFLTI